MRNYTYDDITPEHKEKIERRLEICLIDGPEAFKHKMLQFIEDFGPILSAEKLYICIEIIGKFEKLAVPTDEEQRAINMVHRMEQQEKCPDCGENHDAAGGIAATIIEMMMRRAQPEENHPSNEAENN